MALKCPTGEISRDAFCSRKPGAPEGVKCKDLTSVVCDKRTACKWTPAKCIKDRGTKGEQHNKWIAEKGKLTKMMQRAGIAGVAEGNVVSKLTAKNCQKLSKWMVNNVSAWNEKGKNPKTEGRMMVAVLGRPKSRMIPHEKINACAKIISNNLRSLAPTSRK